MSKASGSAHDKIQCLLCPRGCIMEEYERGRCKVRIHKGGKLYSLVYGKPCAVHVDPVEKKPLYHFLPGTSILSIATAGCCLECKYCQNWEISQAWPEETKNYDLPPAAVVNAAFSAGSKSVAYTYTEPTIFYEYMTDTAALAKQRGLKNVSVTCGYINPEPLRELCGVIDAANVDLKGFSEEFYREVSDGRLQPVLDSLILMKEMGVHVEITNLVVPTKNDQPAMIEEMCAWIVNRLGKDTPLHFSRFHPDYKLRHLPPTPVPALLHARQIAQDAGLSYIYIGNVPGKDFSSTFCPNCKSRIIDREGYRVSDVKVNPETSRCMICQTFIAGVWK